MLLLLLLLAAPPAGTERACVGRAGRAAVTHRGAGQDGKRGCARFVELEPGEPAQRRGRAPRGGAALRHRRATRTCVVGGDGRRRRGRAGAAARPRARCCEAARRRRTGPRPPTRASGGPRLRAGEPLWPARLREAAARDVAAGPRASDGLARSRGAGATRGGAERRRRPSSRCAPGRARARARGRRVRGRAAGPPGPAARAACAPAPGQPFQRARRRRRPRSACADVLVRRARCGARVELREAYDPAAAARRPHLRGVRAGPRADASSFAGDPLPAPSLRRRRSSACSARAALQADALEEGAERIESAFLARGPSAGRACYARAGARPAARRPSSTTVAPGPAARRGLGARGLGGGSARSEPPLPTQPEAPLRGATCSRRTCARCTRALEEPGYPQAKVQRGGARTAAVRLPVVFRVREGPRVMVADVRVEAPAPWPSPASRGRAAPARRQALPRARPGARSQRSLLAAYRDAGYPQAEVEPAVDLSRRRAPGAASRSWCVARRAHVAWTTLVVAASQHTREAVVRRELAVARGRAAGPADACWRASAGCRPWASSSA